jgi:hypothetical protein
MDDDSDGMVDCADSDCVPGFECVEAAPNGWQGYFRVNTSAYPSPSPACPDGSQPQTLFEGPVPAACTACTCGDVENATCTAPPIAVWDGSANCQGGTMFDVTPVVEDGMCFNIPDAPAANRSARLTGASTLMAAGMCQSAGGAVMGAEPWMNQEDVCGATMTGGGGCGNQMACVPKGGGNYTGPVCIRQNGGGSCPNAYPNTITAAMGEIDNRDCTDCQCGNPTNVTCAGGSYTIYDADGCTGNPNTVIDSMVCTDVTSLLDNNTGSFLLTTAPQATGGMCAPSGGQPTGAVVPQGPVKICCQ